MADFFNPNFPQGGYKATHKGNSELYGHTTPNFEIMEGMRFGQFYPAAFLPSVRYEPVFQDRIVIAAGKPVALASNGALVPAGYKLLIAAGAGQGPQYSADDAAMGVKNAQGNFVTAGEYVVDSLIAASISVGACMGVASYDVYMLSGSDPTNPATYKFHNYNRQTGVAVLTDYLLEFPIETFKRQSHKISATAAEDSLELVLAHNTVLAHTIELRINGRRDVDFSFVEGTPDKLTWLSGGVKDGDKIEVTYLYELTGTYATPFAGMATWRGSVKPGDFVTFDKDSAWVAYSPVAIGDTSATNEAANIAAAISKSLSIVGQVVLVDGNFPKQFLDKVKTAHDDRLNGSIVEGRTGQINQLDKMPGSATNGAPHNIHFAGGDQKSGIVRFNMNIK